MSVVTASSVLERVLQQHWEPAFNAGSNFPASLWLVGSAIAQVNPCLYLCDHFGKQVANFLARS